MVYTIPALFLCDKRFFVDDFVVVVDSIVNFVDALDVGVAVLTYNRCSYQTTSKQPQCGCIWRQTQPSVVVYVRPHGVMSLPAELLPADSVETSGVSANRANFASRIFRDKVAGEYTAFARCPRVV